MQLFEVLPETYFNIFSRKNRVIYADVLMALYDQYRVARFGIEYTLMRDLVEELLETRAELGVMVDVQELPIFDSDESLFRIQANAILRLLKENQWIYIETRESWVQYIVLPHYTGRVLSVFHELCEGRSVEYQTYAFSIYAALTGEEAQRRPSMALYDAREKTAEFAEELSLLANNIKHHSEQLRTKETFQGVLDHHFDEYLPAIVEKSYHRLRTSDHVSRYRQTILDTLQKWLLAFFQTINWEFRCDSQNEVVYVVSPDSAHRRNMDKEETIWLLVLRLLYEEKRGELSFAGCPTATMGEIRAKYDLVGFRFFEGKNKTKIKKLIEFTKRYNLADALDEDIYAEDCRFRLFHSLLYAITAEQAEKLHRAIQERMTKKEGDVHEVDDETALD